MTDEFCSAKNITTSNSLAPTGHPFSRFTAPSSIPHGSKLSDILNTQALELIAESFSSVYPAFDTQEFVESCDGCFSDYSLMNKAQAIGQKILEYLPNEQIEVVQILVDSFGPKLTQTEDNGLAGMIYLPHSSILASFADSEDLALVDAGIAACIELTSRFTSEFCIRPYIIHHREKTLGLLAKLTSHSDPHIRRLVSEGTRPRLPWGVHLQCVKKDPQLSIPLLECLKDDDSRYVTRSVANHLGDIGKDHPSLLLSICQTWLEQTLVEGFDAQQAKERRWLIRHALRYPAKKGVEQALRIRSAAKD